MYCQSAISTSSTSLETNPRHVLDLDPQLIINTIHSALLAKIHKHTPFKDFAALKSFGSRLSQRVKSDVHDLIADSDLGPRIDWEVAVSRPIIATFDILEDLGVPNEDAEYILLLAALLILAFELLLLTGNRRAGRIQGFLGRAFEKYLVEPEIVIAIYHSLEAKRLRLARKLADMEVLRAIQDMRILMPDIEQCGRVWRASIPSITTVKNFQRSVSEQIESCALLSKSSMHDNSSAERRRVSKLPKGVSIGQNNTMHISRWRADTSSTLWSGETISIFKDEHPADTASE